MSAPQSRRTIRSFVRRAGRLTPSQHRALEELWPEFGVTLTDETLDLDSLFGRRAPRVLEIGFGNGESLVDQAAADPTMDFLGIEVHEPGLGRCLLKLKSAGINNLRLIRHDAVELMQNQLPDASLRRINLYFPDPWPKKRHHKRRILNPSFLHLAARKLEPGGTLHIATDWEDYARYIDELIASDGAFALLDSRVHQGDRPLERPTTKFERRGLAAGHRIRDWKLVRN